MDGLKQVENIFPQNQLNYLIIEKIKETRQLQNNIRLDDLEYTKMRKKIWFLYIFITYSFLERYTRGKFVIRKC